MRYYDWHFLFRMLDPINLILEYESTGRHAKSAEASYAYIYFYSQNIQSFLEFGPVNVSVEEELWCICPGRVVNFYTRFCGF